MDSPDCAIFDEEDVGRGWLSGFVRGAQHWDRSRLDLLENRESLGRMLALDAIIHNEDRNTENMIFEASGGGKSYRCWAIDMESALVSRPRALAAKGARSPSPHALPSDLTVDAVIRKGAVEAGQEASRLPEDLTREIAEVSTAAAGVLDRDVLADALVRRCRHATEIVEDYLGKIERR